MCVIEQELILYMDNSNINKFAVAVEPRQLALNVCMILIVKTLLIVHCRFVMYSVSWIGLI
jgi:hypothetical protein